ncbi:flagellar biosynthetic protein FliR [Coprothermobacteraceae bacterium]|nr:flagellar biosynthetic protein FliR [Coprothermobacteraceae bacterium]
MEPNTLGYWPVFFRLLGLLVASPVVPARFVSARLKVIVAAVTALVVVPSLTSVFSVGTSYQWIEVYVTEFALGALLGFMTGVVYWGIVFAGDLWDIMSGFQMMTALDPFTSVPQPVMTQFFSLMVAGVVVTSGLLENLVVTLLMSYKLVPAGSFIKLAVSEPVLFLTRAFLLGVAVAVPIVVLIIVMQIVMGIVSKGASGFPVFIVWLPMQTSISLVLLYVSLPAVYLFTRAWAEWMLKYLNALLTAV